jgi:hypothetical protein
MSRRIRWRASWCVGLRVSRGRCRSVRGRVCRRIGRGVSRGIRRAMRWSLGRRL